MRMVFTSALYIVLVRDNKGGIWVLQGPKGSVHARSIHPHDMKGANQFNIPQDYGMDRKDFLRLHKALETEVEVWRRPPGGVAGLTLKKETVFYRKLELKTSPVDIEEHHRTKPKKTPVLHALVGATCHYRTTTISLVGRNGATLSASSFTHQIYTEAKKQGWNIESHRVTGEARTREGCEVSVQFKFEIGTPVSRVRKHMLATFPVNKE